MFMYFRAYAVTRTWYDASVISFAGARRKRKRLELDSINRLSSLLRFLLDKQTSRSVALLQGATSTRAACASGSHQSRRRWPIPCATS